MITIKCHNDIPSAFNFGPITWRPGTDNHPWDSCSYCGCIHPEYLLNALKNPETKLEGSDWKYNWPHKFYITVPNPKPETLFALGRTNFKPDHGNYEQVGNEWVEYGTLSTLRGKWYNEHLLDEGVPEELFNLIAIKSGIRFSIENGKLRYIAPYHGFQAG